MKKISIILTFILCIGIICPQAMAEELTTIYTPDGRTAVIDSSQVWMYQNVGWYTVPVCTVYALDGRSAVIYSSDLYAYTSAGWYPAPVTLMYAPGGKTAVVYKSEADAYASVGWYFQPVTVMYNTTGGSIVIPTSEVAAYKKVGWYTTPQPAGLPISEASIYNVYCYFRDVDYMQCLKNKKIKLIPAMEITYRQYKNALENNNNVILDGKSFTIDTSMIEDYGYAFLEDEFNSYLFVEPDEFNYNVSVVEGYMNKKPIEVSISDNLMIRYGVLGYDKSNEPYGYESLGRKVMYTADEYFQHFEEYSFHTYYRATITNGELTILDVMYHE